VIPIDQGEAVDRMIAEGRKVLDDAVAEYRPCAIVAAYSGGDDSVVTTHFTLANYPDAFAFNADTRIGLAPAREHIARTCARFGWTLDVERADAEGPPRKMLDKANRRYVPFDPSALQAGEWRDGATAYEEQALNYGFPGRTKFQHAKMYQRLKERPIRRLIRRLRAKGSGPALFLSGIRGDESATRAGYRREVSVGSSGDVWVNPFYWRTAADFAAYRDEFGLSANPVKPRCGISGECTCLTFPSDTTDGRERDRYAAIDPEFGAYIAGLEARVQEVFPWGYGESPPSWWKDQARGQGFLFDVAPPSFRPMCVGCERGNR
jgi:3'-phosphoadenosine 5'-phosphosulfate sulfotransferase (PAPS reductase)/FAD synthetase